MHLFSRTSMSGYVYTTCNNSNVKTKIRQAERLKHVEVTNKLDGNILKYFNAT